MTTNRKKPVLLVDNPMDVLSHLMIPGIALLALFNLFMNYQGSELYPTVSSDSFELMLKGTGALMGIVVLKVFFATKKADKRLIANTFEFTQINDGIYATATYFAIQIIVKLIQGMAMFQVAAVDVLAFFVSAAIIEELLYRGLLVMVVQLVVARVFHAKNKKQMLLPNLFAIILSGLVFAAVHERYWDDPFLMLLTFAGGCSQAFWYIKTKSLLVPMMAHSGVNLLASGSLLQSL